MDLLTQTASERFGISYLFPYQRLVITNILRRAGLFGEEEQSEAPPHQIVLLPTGAGKSLCFMLPACLLQGLTIVAFPLLGLMADQLRRVEEAGLKGALLKGGMSRREKEEIWMKAAAGELDMLLTNPEMLVLPEVRRRLSEIEIAHLVLDEAHTIPEWGETFRPACLELGRILPELKVNQITAFTATASPLILEKIKTILFDGLAFNLVRANPDRVNIFYEVRPVLSRMAELTRLARQAERPALIFCPTRRQTEQCALELRQRLRDQDIRFYHAGLSKELRSELEAWYFHHPRAILAATCAYGMGMDKQNIRTVIHYALPASVEAYLQESGRAGRDRRPCRAVLLYHPEDAGREDQNPDARQRERYARLAAFAADKDRCRRESLLAVLEAEPEDCDNCDVCRKEVRNSARGEDLLKALIRRYRGHFSPEELALFLLGRHIPLLRDQKYHRAEGFGSFKDGDPDDVRAMIRGLMASGAVRLRGGILGGGKRLYPAPPPAGKEEKRAVNNAIKKNNYRRMG